MGSETHRARGKSQPSPVSTPQISPEGTWTSGGMDAMEVTGGRDKQAPPAQGHLSVCGDVGFAHTGGNLQPRVWSPGCRPPLASSLLPLLPFAESTTALLPGGSRLLLLSHLSLSPDVCCAVPCEGSCSGARPQTPHSSREQKECMWVTVAAEEVTAGVK